MSMEQGAPPATAPAKVSPRKTKLINNYERLFYVTKGARKKLATLEAMTEKQIEIEIEDELYRVHAVSSKCECGITVFRILRTTHSALEYDGSSHTCRKKTRQAPDLYQKTLRSLR